MEKSMLEGQ